VILGSAAEVPSRTSASRTCFNEITDVFLRLAFLERGEDRAEHLDLRVRGETHEFVGWFTGPAGLICEF
jgi:hypothetical protein